MFLRLTFLLCLCYSYGLDLVSLRESNRVGAIAALAFLMVIGESDKHIVYTIIMSSLTINLIMVRCRAEYLQGALQTYQHWQQYDFSLTS